MEPDKKISLDDLWDSYFQEIETVGDEYNPYEPTRRTTQEYYDMDDSTDSTISLRIGEVGLNRVGNDTNSWLQDQSAAENRAYNDLMRPTDRSSLSANETEQLRRGTLGGSNSPNSNDRSGIEIRNEGNGLKPSPVDVTVRPGIAGFTENSQTSVKVGINVSQTVKEAGTAVAQAMAQRNQNNAQSTANAATSAPAQTSSSTSTPTTSTQSGGNQSTTNPTRPTGNNPGSTTGGGAAGGGRLPPSR